MGAPAPVRFSRVLGHLKGDVTGGNPTVIPGTDSELVGADALIGPMGNVLKLEWVDVLNRPQRILTEVFYAGKYSLPSSVTAAPCHLYIIVQLPLAIVRF